MPEIGYISFEDIQIFICVSQMLNFYQKLCLVNPHLFGSREVIDQHFRSGLPVNEYLEYRSVKTFDLRGDARQQWRFRLALETHSDTLSFILQNGIVYSYQEFQKMLSNGELEKITGGVAQVDLGYLFRNKQCP